MKECSINILINLFMHDVEKWPNILLKSGSVNARFLKYVWSFFNIVQEKVKKQN